MNQRSSDAYDRVLAFVDNERAQLNAEEELSLVSNLEAFFDEEEGSLRDFAGEEE